MYSTADILRFFGWLNGDHVILGSTSPTFQDRIPDYQKYPRWDTEWLWANPARVRIVNTKTWREVWASPPGFSSVGQRVLLVNGRPNFVYVRSALLGDRASNTVETFIVGLDGVERKFDENSEFGYGLGEIDGQYVVTASSGGTAYLVNKHGSTMQLSRQPDKPELLGGKVWGSLSPDGRYGLIAVFDRVTVWNRKTKKSRTYRLDTSTVDSPDQPSAPLSDYRFDLPPRYGAVWRPEFTISWAHNGILIWNEETMAIFVGPDDQITRLRITPNGRIDAIAPLGKTCKTARLLQSQ